MTSRPLTGLLTGFPLNDEGKKENKVIEYRKMGKKTQLKRIKGGKCRTLGQDQQKPVDEGKESISTLRRKRFRGRLTDFQKHIDEYYFV